MADDTARALGAGSKPIKIAGKEVRPRPLSVKELSQVERECLNYYKRQYLETFSQNLDLLKQADPNLNPLQFMEEKMTEAARWDLDDLPLRYAYDPDKLIVNDELKEWAKTKLDFKTKDDANNALPEAVVTARLKRVIAAALDSEMLSQKLYEKTTNHEPKKLKIPYSSWWVTGSTEGMIAFVHTCFMDQGITRDDLLKEMSKNPALIMQVSREIEALSAPNPGNG